MDKKKKRKTEMKGKELAQSQDTAAEKEGDPAPLYYFNGSDQNTVEQRDQPKQRQGAHEDTYAVVKKSKKSKPNAKETATPITSHTVESPEEVYTAVKKKPNGSTAEDEEEAPPLPPHTLEELYTAVKKKPKGSAAEDEEEAPSLPPHT